MIHVVLSRLIPQDLCFRSSHHSKTNMVWFKVDEPEGCKEAPEEVSSEELPKDICEDVGF